MSLASCKSETDLMIGLWQGSEFYTNDTLDEANDLFKTFTMRIEAGGTGTQTVLGYAQPFNWTYNEDSKTLHIETEDYDAGDGVTINGDTLDVNVTLIDKEALWFTYTDEDYTIEQRWVRVNE